MICSKTKLSSELNKIKELLIEYGYPTGVLLSCIIKSKLLTLRYYKTEIKYFRFVFVDLPSFFL